MGMRSIMFSDTFQNNNRSLSMAKTCTFSGLAVYWCIRIMWQTALVDYFQELLSPLVTQTQQHGWIIAGWKYWSYHSSNISAASLNTLHLNNHNTCCCVATSTVCEINVRHVTSAVTQQKKKKTVLIPEETGLLHHSRQRKENVSVEDSGWKEKKNCGMLTIEVFMDDGSLHIY